MNGTVGVFDFDSARGSVFNTFGHALRMISVLLLIVRRSKDHGVEAQVPSRAQTTKHMFTHVSSLNKAKTTRSSV